MKSKITSTIDDPNGGSSKKCASITATKFFDHLLACLDRWLVKPD
ncbi:hypothetical protein [Undibacterium sp. Ji22W]